MRFPQEFRANAHLSITSFCCSAWMTRHNSLQPGLSLLAHWLSGFLGNAPIPNPQYSRDRVSSMSDLKSWILMQLRWAGSWVCAPRPRPRQDTEVGRGGKQLFTCVLQCLAPSPAHWSSLPHRIWKGEWTNYGPFLCPFAIPAPWLPAAPWQFWTSLCLPTQPCPPTKEDVPLHTSLPIT